MLIFLGSKYWGNFSIKGLLIFRPSWPNCYFFTVEFARRKPEPNHAGTWVREREMAGAFWGSRVMEIVKKHDSGGLVWKRIKLTTTRKANAKKRLQRVWQVRSFSLLLFFPLCCPIYDGTHITTVLRPPITLACRLIYIRSRYPALKCPNKLL